MRRPLLTLVALATAALAASGCDAGSFEDFEAQPVVSAVLVAGAPLPNVTLTRSAPIDQPYDPDTRRITGATVTISRLRADGTVEKTNYYREVDGIYEPDATRRESPLDIAVYGGERYRLDVIVPGQAEAITAETTVPTAFEVVRPPADTIVYQDPALAQGPPVTISANPDPGRQRVFVFTTRALAPDSFAVATEAGGYERAFLPGRFGLTPFAADIVADRDVDPEDFVVGTSPLLNEANYTREPDGALTINVPWLAVNYFGPQRFTATALDDALVDFFQSQAIQFVPTTISPGEIPSVVTNVRNGLGVFGAIAQAETEAYVAEP